jgi:sugar/nucleoside kinase (ribokinase family)
VPLPGTIQPADEWDFGPPKRRCYIVPGRTDGHSGTNGRGPLGAVALRLGDDSTTSVTRLTAETALPACGQIRRARAACIIWEEYVMFDYGIAGAVSIDYIITSQDRIHEGILGGAAAYAACGARLWTDSVVLFSRIGPQVPNRLLGPLHDHGIHVATSDRGSSAPIRHDFYAYSSPTQLAKGSAASHYLRLGRPIPKPLLPAPRSAVEHGDVADRDPMPADMPASALPRRGVHLAAVGATSASMLSRALRSARIPIVSYEPADDMMRPERAGELGILLQDIDAFLPSLRQSYALSSSRQASIWEMAETMAAMGPRIVMIKDPTRGLWLFDGEHQARWTIPLYPSSIVDVTGAGHAIGGGFLFGLSQDEDPLEGALHGAVAGSLAAEGTGPCYPLEAMPGLARARLRALRQTAKRA